MTAGSSSRRSNSAAPQDLHVFPPWGSTTLESPELHAAPSRTLAKLNLYPHRPSHGIAGAKVGGAYEPMGSPELIQSPRSPVAGPPWGRPNPWARWSHTGRRGPQGRRTRLTSETTRTPTLSYHGPPTGTRANKSSQLPPTSRAGCFRTPVYRPQHKNQPVDRPGDVATSAKRASGRQSSASCCVHGGGPPEGRDPQQGA